MTGPGCLLMFGNKVAGGFSSSIPDPYDRWNLILIGGPYAKVWTKTITDHMPQGTPGKAISPHVDENKDFCPTTQVQGPACDLQSNLTASCGFLHLHCIQHYLFTCMASVSTVVKKKRHYVDHFNTQSLLPGLLVTSKLFTHSNQWIFAASNEPGTGKGQ